MCDGCAENVCLIISVHSNGNKLYLYSTVHAKNAKQSALHEKEMIMAFIEKQWLL